MFSRALAIVLVGVLSVGAFASGASTPAVPSECDTPADIPILGPACAVEGGYTIALPDGRTLFTHGPDPRPSPTAAPLGLASPVTCVGEDEPHARVILAFPSDYPAPATSQHAKAVVAGVLNANGVIVAAGAKFGVPMSLKVLCDENDLPKVFVIHLATTFTETSFGSIAIDVYEAGYATGPEKAWVFTPVNGDSCNCGGVSTIQWDTRPGPENRNNLGGSISLTFMSEFGTNWALYETALHELTHAMGGVQPGAPDSSGTVQCYFDRWTNMWYCYPTGFHCNDGVDIMCYADGAAGSNYSETTCPVGHRVVSITMAYDCDNDSYFHPSPPPESYLANAWNVGSVHNHYIARG